MQPNDTPAAASTGAKIAITIAASLLLIVVCFFLEWLLGRAGLHFIPAEIFFPFATIGFFIASGTGAVGYALFGTLLVYLQLPIYGIVACKGWINNRARRTLIGIAAIHLVAVLVSFAVSLFMRWKVV